MVLSSVTESNEAVREACSGPALRSPCRIEDRMQDFRYALKSR